MFIVYLDFVSFAQEWSGVERSDKLKNNYRVHSKWQF